MKQFITIALLLVATAGFGQTISLTPGTTFGWGPLGIRSIPCGTWEKQPQQITEWVTVDTLGKKEQFDTARHWVYDEEKPVAPSGWTDAVYRPCGFGSDEQYQQFRVCSLTGIRQKRARYIPYKYVEPPRTEYQRVEDSLYAAAIPGTSSSGSPLILKISDTASFLVVSWPRSVKSIDSLITTTKLKTKKKRKP